MNLAQDEAVSLQTAQRLGEHFLRNASNFLLQRCVSASPMGEDLNNKRRPFIRDSIQHDARRALRFQDRRAGRFHQSPVSQGAAV